MDTSLPPRGSREKTILVAAIGWEPSFGGINTFSLDFCLALGQLLKGTAGVGPTGVWERTRTCDESS
jgi:hypothetical protein